MLDEMLDNLKRLFFFWFLLFKKKMFCSNIADGVVWHGTSIALVHLALRKYYERCVSDADCHGCCCVKTLIGKEMETCGFSAHNDGNFLYDERRLALYALNAMSTQMSEMSRRGHSASKWKMNDWRDASSLIASNDEELDTKDPVMDKATFDKFDLFDGIGISEGIGDEDASKEKEDEEEDEDEEEPQKKFQKRGD